MIVDDEPFNLIALEALLNISNIFQIEKAFNGRQALALLKERNYDIDMIMTDFQMPEMNGVEFAEEVREMQCRNAVSDKLMIVLVSGNIFDKDQFKRY